MTDFVKRYQSRLSNAGFDAKDRSRQSITVHLDVLGIKPEDITEETDKEVYQQLVDVLKGSNPGIADSDLSTVDNSLQEEIQQSADRQPALNGGQPTGQSEPNNQNGLSLFLNQSQKENMIAEYAQNNGINLVHTQVQAIAVNMASEFSGMTEAVQAIANHMVAYSKALAAKQEGILMDALGTSQQTLNDSAKRVHDHLSNFASESHQRSLDYKSAFQGFADCLPIS